MTWLARNIDSWRASRFGCYVLIPWSSGGRKGALVKSFISKQLTMDPKERKLEMSVIHFGIATIAEGIGPIFELHPNSSTSRRYDRYGCVTKLGVLDRDPVISK